MPKSYPLIARDLLKTALPMAASFTFSAELVLLVAFLTRLNAARDQVASISLTVNLFTFFNSVGMAPLYGISLLISKKIGELRAAEREGDELLAQVPRDEMRAIYQASLPIAAVLGTLSGGVSCASKVILTAVFRQNEAVAEYVQKNAELYAVAFLALAMRLATEQVMFSFEKAVPAMVLGLSTFAVGMGLSYGLGFGASLDRVGIFIGYDVESYLTALAFAGFVAWQFKAFKFFHLSWSATHTRAVKDLLNLGKGIAFTNATEFVNLFMCNVFAGTIGEAEQAAFSAIMQYSLFILLMQWAFAQTVAQSMSRAMGEGHFLEASRVGKCGLSLPPILLSVIPLVFAVRPDALTSLLGIEDQAVIQNVALISPYMAVAVTGELIRFSALQQLRVMKDGNIASLISGISVLLGMGLAAILSKEKELLGIAIAYMSTVLFTATALMLFRWRPRIGPDVLEAISTQEPAPSCLSRLSWLRREETPPQAQEVPLEAGLNASYGT